MLIRLWGLEVPIIARKLINVSHAAREIVTVFAVTFLFSVTAVGQTVNTSPQWKVFRRYGGPTPWLRVCDVVSRAPY